MKTHILKKEYYKILDVTTDYPQDKMKKAYLKRALLFHPDKNAGEPYPFAFVFFFPSSFGFAPALEKRRISIQLTFFFSIAPGADECFKAIADAFNILGDVQQRAIFDEQGAAAFEGPRASASRAGQSTSGFHGFDGFNAGAGPSFQFGGNQPFGGQINPEDFINMFFGGGGLGGRGT